MSFVMRTALAAVLAAAAALGALWGAGFVLSGEAVTETAAAQASEAAPGPASPAGLSRYDRFSAPAGDDRAAAVNAACGFSPSLTGGGTRIVMAGDPLDQVLIERAEDAGEGEDGAFTRFTARADAVHGFARDGELYIQAGHDDRDGLQGRVWLLDASGEPTFSGPILARGRMALGCDDASTAAAAFNAALAPAGGPAEPVRAGVRAFQIGDGVAEWDYPSVDGFVAACTPDAALADLPAGAPFVLRAEYDAEARYGEAIVHDMSDESLAGSPEPMAYVTIADLTGAPDTADLRKLSVPLSWSDLVASDGAVGLVYRFSAVEARQWMIEANGARTHSMGAGAFGDIRLPCADPQAGAAALRALRERALNAEG